MTLGRVVDTYVSLAWSVRGYSHLRERYWALTRTTRTVGIDALEGTQHSIMESPPA